jgi:hypothetical protein
MNNLILAVWAATIPLMPYALLRKSQNLLAACVVIFFMLLIDVFIMLNTPNPNHILVIPVTVP